MEERTGYYILVNIYLSLSIVIFRVIPDLSLSFTYNLFDLMKKLITQLLHIFHHKAKLISWWHSASRTWHHAYVRAALTDQMDISRSGAHVAYYLQTWQTSHMVHQSSNGHKRFPRRSVPSHQEKLGFMPDHELPSYAGGIRQVIEPVDLLLSPVSPPTYGGQWRDYLYYH